MPQRRAPMIARAITAAALYGTVGWAATAPAVADDSRPGPAAGTDSAGSGAAGASNDRGSRRHGRRDGEAAPGNATGSAIGEGPGGLCPWHPRPVPPVLPVTVYSRGNSGLIAAVTVPVAPVPVFGDRAPVATAADAPIGDIPEVLPPFAAPAAVGPAPVAAVPAPRPRAAPAAASVPAQLPAPVPAPVPALRRPVAGAQPQAPVLLGNPDEVRDADLAKVLAMALPGLAAMAGMTAFGGLVGYRQARAGYLLRAAGAGRFLQ